MRRNEAFSGLEQRDACKVECYLHFRNVQTEAKKKELEEPSAPFNPTFLEQANRDIPMGCWSSQVDATGNLAMLRSLKWIGYSFYHVSCTNKFGGFYLGDGLKNLELQFQIQ